MKTIALYSDFKVNDAGNSDKIKSILDQINIDNEPEVTLDLTHCIIDYPATSTLIDKILLQLSEKTGQKKLIIAVSYSLPEQTLINDLLGDSKFFEIEAKKEIPIKELREKIEKFLKPAELQMTVTILDRMGKPKDTFTYGI
ncbi:MAG: hypothetical protein JWP78_2065 [Mucilaginibacter sp.]|nr:hypothetical protein [Mucilaginibacter sp.]